MNASTVPVKTPQGQAELDTRRLRLSQRHRTVLLLVDGRRSEAQVRHLAAQAGVAAACFDELVALEFIALPVANTPIVAAAHDETSPAPAGTDSIGTQPSPTSDSLLPSAGALPPDSSAPTRPIGIRATVISWFPEIDADDAPSNDPAFVRAREILLRVMKSEAPVAGSLTLRRIRKARTRADLGALVPEVEAHLGKRSRTLAASQSLASVRQLLSPSFDSNKPIA